MIDNHRNGISASPSAGPDAAAKGFSRAMLTTSFTLLEQSALAPTRAKAGVTALRLTGEPEATRGEKSVAEQAAGETVTRRTVKSSRPNFLFSARDFPGVQAPGGVPWPARAFNRVLGSRGDTPASIFWS
jgi:hypothetical protein